MNVRLTPHDAPRRTDLYGGIDHITSDDVTLSLRQRPCAFHSARVIEIPLRQVAAIALDDDYGDWF